jgi:DNA modification methylase
MRSVPVSPPPVIKPRRKPAINALQEADRPIHGWYRFVLSYPPHLVRQYAERFDLGKKSLLLDPFCGTGTTLVEAKKLGIPSIGCDAHPFAALVSQVKTRWDLEVTKLSRLLEMIAAKASAESAGSELELSEAEWKLIPTGFLSERPLRKLLLLRKAILEVAGPRRKPAREFFLLAMAHTVANGAGNFAFGPEIYRTKAKLDYDVFGHFVQSSESMIADLHQMQRDGRVRTPSEVRRSDARELRELPDGISAVITSPPYPNEKDYTRTTRVETLLLGLISDRPSLRQMKEDLLRSNTRNVFTRDRDADEVREFSSIQKICATIEARRIELRKTSGFERLYHKVVAHYFGGMRRHFRNLYPRLAKGAQLAYVVGDQLSFLMVPVPTAQLLGEVAESEGYEVTGCELWRERVGTKVRNCAEGRKVVRVREETLLLRKK